MKKNIETYKTMLTEVFSLEPYSKERYEKVEEIKQFEKETGLSHRGYELDLKNKTIKCDILTKNNGLYETLETFTINKITNIDEYQPF